MYNVETEVRLLKVYVGVASMVTLMGIGIVTTLGAQTQRQRFAEIDVERINVVEADGKLRLVISNGGRAPDPVISGKPLKRVGGNAPGLIFFNEEGEERGGLTYSSNSASLTFDKHHQPELLRFAYSEGPQGSEGGLSVIDRPNLAPSEDEMARMIAQEATLRTLPPAELQAALAKRTKEIEAECATSGCGVSRVFVGKTVDRMAVVSLTDAVGRARLRLTVSPQGAARLDFLDENGIVTETFPSKR